MQPLQNHKFSTFEEAHAEYDRFNTGKSFLTQLVALIAGVISATFAYKPAFIWMVNKLSDTNEKAANTALKVDVHSPFKKDLQAHSINAEKAKEILNIGSEGDYLIRQMTGNQYMLSVNTGKEDKKGNLVINYDFIEVRNDGTLSVNRSENYQDLKSLLEKRGANNIILPGKKPPPRESKAAKAIKDELKEMAFNYTTKQAEDRLRTDEVGDYLITNVEGNNNLFMLFVYEGNEPLNSDHIINNYILEVNHDGTVSVNGTEKYKNLDEALESKQAQFVLLPDPQPKQEEEKNIGSVKEVYVELRGTELPIGKLHNFLYPSSVHTFNDDEFNDFVSLLKIGDYFLSKTPEGKELELTIMIPSRVERAGQRPLIYVFTIDEENIRIGREYGISDGKYKDLQDFLDKQGAKDFILPL